MIEKREGEEDQKTNKIQTLRIYDNLLILYDTC